MDGKKISSVIASFWGYYGTVITLVFFVILFDLITGIVKVEVTEKNILKYQNS